MSLPLTMCVLQMHLCLKYVDKDKKPPAMAENHLIHLDFFIYAV